MSFTSLTFMAGMIVVSLLNYFLKGNMRKILFAVVNILFYLSFGISNCYYLFILSVVIYLISKYVPYKHLGSIIALAGLIFFKYLGWLNFSFLSIAAPLGISFFSFKMISYSEDIAKGKYEVPSFLDYFVYITFFAQMISGPIEQFGHFNESLQDDHTLTYDELKNGLFRFVLGAFEKVVIADRLSLIVNTIFNNYTEYHGWTFLFGIVLYTFELYADFDGYSNMAIGLGQMVGIRAKENFRQPYLSHNPVELWNRWHMSLSEFFKNYVYIPLGGNRKGQMRQYFNVMVVFVLSGLWHGSSWGYLLWGTLSGVTQLLYRILFPNKKGNILLNYLLICWLWLFFRVQDMGELAYIYRSIATELNMGFSLGAFGLGKSEVLVSLVLVVLFIGVDILRDKGYGLKDYAKLPLLVRWFGYFVIMWMFILFGIYGRNYDAAEFIYKQF